MATNSKTTRRQPKAGRAPREYNHASAALTSSLEQDSFPTLRKAALEIVKHADRSGGTLEEQATTLGVSPSTYHKARRLAGLT